MNRASQAPPQRFPAPFGFSPPGWLPPLTHYSYLLLNLMCTSQPWPLGPFHSITSSGTTDFQIPKRERQAGICSCPHAVPRVSSLAPSRVACRQPGLAAQSAACEWNAFRQTESGQCFTLDLVSSRTLWNTQWQELCRWAGSLEPQCWVLIR